MRVVIVDCLGADELGPTPQTYTGCYLLRRPVEDEDPSSSVSSVSSLSPTH
jgi:hypothetical protein